MSFEHSRDDEGALLADAILYVCPVRREIFHVGACRVIRRNYPTLAVDGPPELFVSISPSGADVVGALVSFSQVGSDVICRA